MRGWMYILECIDGSYYTGSTNNLEIRIAQHQAGDGANYTKKRLPVSLVYYEEFARVDEAFYREKQVQGWSRRKKEALIRGSFVDLSKLSECRNETHCRGFGSAQPPTDIAQLATDSAQPPIEMIQPTAEIIQSLADLSYSPINNQPRCLSEVEGRGSLETQNLSKLLNFENQS